MALPTIETSDAAVIANLLSKALFTINTLQTALEQKDEQIASLMNVVKGKKDNVEDVSQSTT